MSTDQVLLASWKAAKEAGIPKELAEVALQAFLGYQESHSIWPKDFMP